MIFPTQTKHERQNNVIIFTSRSGIIRSILICHNRLYTQTPLTPFDTLQVNNTFIIISKFLVFIIQARTVWFQLWKWKRKWIVRDGTMWTMYRKQCNICRWSSSGDEPRRMLWKVCMHSKAITFFYNGVIFMFPVRYRYVHLEYHVSVVHYICRLIEYEKMW